MTELIKSRVRTRTRCADSMIFSICAPGTPFLGSEAFKANGFIIKKSKFAVSLESVN